MAEFPRLIIPRRLRQNRRIPPGALPCESAYDGYIHFGLYKKDRIKPKELHDECERDMRQHDCLPPRVRVRRTETG